MSDTSDLSDLFYNHFKQGDESFRAGNLAGAIAEWREASRLNPQDADAHYNVGWGLLEQGEEEGAVSELQEALRLQPDHEWAYRRLATTLTHLGRSREVLEVWQTAIQSGPDASNLYLGLGHHLIRQAEQNKDRDGWRDGRAALQKAVKINPANAHALRCLGMTEWRLGKRRQAIETLKKAIAADPTERGVYFTLGKYQKRMLHWRGLVQTIRALNQIPMPDEEFRGYARCWHRLTLFTGFVTGFVAVFLWLRRRWG